MRFEIVLAPEAVVSLGKLSAYERKAVKDAIETHLRHDPTRVSKSRAKRLRGLARPQYRLRVNEIRVFYDVTDTQVQILAIIRKIDAQAWLGEFGEKGS